MNKVTPVVLTHHGYAFAVEMADPAGLPIRVRCQLCPWQATALLAHAAAVADVHALAHLAAVVQDGRIDQIGGRS